MSLLSSLSFGDWVLIIIGFLILRAIYKKIDSYMENQAFLNSVKRNSRRRVDTLFRDPVDPNSENAEERIKANLDYLAELARPRDNKGKKSKKKKR